MSKIRFSVQKIQKYWNGFLFKFTNAHHGYRMTLSAEWPNINFCERQFLRDGRRQFLELHVRTTRRIGFCRNRSTPPGKLFGLFPNDCLSVILERHMSVDHIPTNLLGELLSPNCAIQWILPPQSHTC